VLTLYPFHWSKCPTKDDLGRISFPIHDDQIAGSDNDPILYDWLRVVCVKASLCI